MKISLFPFSDGLITARYFPFWQKMCWVCCRHSTAKKTRHFPLSQSPDAFGIIRRNNFKKKSFGWEVSGKEAVATNASRQLILSKREGPIGGLGYYCQKANKPGRRGRKKKRGGVDTWSLKKKETDTRLEGIEYPFGKLGFRGPWGFFPCTCTRGARTAREKSFLHAVYLNDVLCERETFFAFFLWKKFFLREFRQWLDITVLYSSFWKQASLPKTSFRKLEKTNGVFFSRGLLLRFMCPHSSRRDATGEEEKKNTTYSKKLAFSTLTPV